MGKQQLNDGAAAVVLMSRKRANDAMKRIDDYAGQILAAMETRDMFHTQLGALKKLSRLMPINTVAARREITERLIEAERYTC